jgi:hypothetical protein
MLAGETLLAGVDSNVIGQFALSFERFVAEHTYMWLFVGVSLNVIGQMRRLRKRLATRETRVRFLAGVGSLVLLEERLANECLIAVRAGVLLHHASAAVRPNVIGELVRTREGLAAVCTAVRFFSGVTSHVIFQIRRLRKLLATVRTLVRLLSGVSS